MTAIPISDGQGFVQRALFSPGEKRLRVGWRLLLHGTILLSLLILLSLVIGLGLLILGDLQLLTSDLSSPLPFFISFLSILCATWFARRRLDRRNFASLGLSRNGKVLPDLAFGFALMGLLMGLIFALEWKMGWTGPADWAWESTAKWKWLGELAKMFIVFGLVSFQEELLSRGYHLQNLADSLSLPWAISLSSLIFSLLHLGNPHANLLSLLGILASGLFLAYAWLRTRQLWLSIGLHLGWNFFEGPVFGFPVSGQTTYALINHSLRGPTLFTGGAFGPEAGLILLPALALGTTLIYLYTSRRSRRMAILK